MMRAARAVIDLSALSHNLQRVRAAAPESRVLAMVKADGYGHGLVTVAQALAGADGFGVACVDEAAWLRQAGIEHMVVSLQGFRDQQELIEAAMLRIDLAIHAEDQLELLARTRLAQPVSIWLKIDTGMARLGFRPEQAATVYRRLRELPQVVGAPVLMTHLACADDRDGDYTRHQLRRFARAIQGLEGLRSIANSAAILAAPETHADWTRPGIMLYGGAPFADRSAAQDDLRPAMTLAAPLVAIKQLDAGDPIGYGGSWTCPEPMAIGIAAIGYGDGYPRHATSGTPVLVNGRRAQLIGRVCMDMITIDLRGCPARAGDEVTLWGAGLPVEEIARCAGTVNYELLCAVSGRVHAMTVRQMA
jgi:alanine racemase